jgi:hypothetical protein
MEKVYMQEQYRILGFVVKAVMRYFRMFCRLSKFCFLEDLLT